MYSESAKAFADRIINGLSTESSFSFTRAVRLDLKNMEEKLNFLLLQENVLKTLKGKRSSAQMSQRLGFKTNQFYRWESNHSTMTWKDFILVCRRQNLDLNNALKMGLHYSGKPSDESELIKHFFGRTTLSQISIRLNVSISTVSRWKQKKLDLPLEQFLRMAGLSEYSLLNFLKFLLPNFSFIREIEFKTSNERNLMTEHPYLAAVIRCFELVRYQNLKTHQSGFISEILGISLKEEVKAIELLEQSNMILKKPDGKYKAVSKQLNTEVDFNGWKKLREHWNQEANVYLLGLQSPSSNSIWGYKVFSVNPDAITALKNCYLRFYQEMDQIGHDFSIQNNGGSDRVMLLNVQLLDLEDIAQSRKNLKTSK